jgi:hypothetical protein
MSGSGPDRSQTSPHAAGPQGIDMSPAELDEATQKRLGSFLARRAEELIREPMPDGFLRLLARMEAKERGE